MDAENILNVLTSRAFEKWYAKKLVDYMEQSEDFPPDKDEILKDIVNMFKLYDFTKNI